MILKILKLLFIEILIQIFIMRMNLEINIHILNIILLYL